MLTSTATNSKKAFSGARGFSLIEIIVALSLIAMVFVLIPSSPFDNDRDRLEEAAADLERAVKFAQDEAVLRNKIIRLKIDIDAVPGEYVVEVGPNTPFIVPKWASDPKFEFKNEQEKAKAVKSFNSQFTPVPEFKDISKKFADEIAFIGAALKTDLVLAQKGQFYIFFYPTGNRDASIMIISNNQEVVSISIPALSPKTVTSFKIIDKENGDQKRIAEEMFSLWQREIN